MTIIDIPYYDLVISRLVLDPRLTAQAVNP